MSSASEIARLYDDHAQALFAFLLDFTRSESDTRDLLQEVFVRLAQRAELLKGVESERGFLIRLAHNLAIDAMRRRDARDRCRDRFEVETSGELAAGICPDERTFEAALESAFAELPPEQRAVVHLKTRAGLTFEQIAEALDISPNTAASRYRYGVDKLRERLRPLYDEIK